MEAVLQAEEAAALSGMDNRHVVRAGSEAALEWLESRSVESAAEAIAAMCMLLIAIECSEEKRQRMEAAQAKPSMN